MQIHNVNVPVKVTARHMTMTDALREYAIRKIDGLHLDYPRIIDAKVILDFHQHHHRQICEIILHCCDHITIQATSESPDDMYASIDETILKVARGMRKHKTRVQKHTRARQNESIRTMPIFSPA
jgi:putative sigma-54 modulation protein